MADVELKQRRELVRQEIAKVLMRQTPAFVRIWEMERDQRTAFKEALDAQIAKEKFAGLFLNEYLAILVSIGIDERDVTVMVDVLKRFQSFGRELDEILDRYTNLKETNSKAAAEGFDKLCETLATVAEEHYHRRRGRG